jgi:hypothetical protein
MKLFLGILLKKATPSATIFPSKTVGVARPGEAKGTVAGNPKTWNFGLSLSKKAKTRAANHQRHARHSPRQKLGPKNGKIVEKTAPSLGPTSSRPRKTPDNTLMMFWKNSTKRKKRRENAHY